MNHNYFNNNLLYTNSPPDASFRRTDPSLRLATTRRLPYDARRQSTQNREVRVQSKTVDERWNALQMRANAAMRRLRREWSDGSVRFELYDAGTTDGRVRFGFFPRDLLSTALMLRDPDLLREAIRFSAHTIGRRFDPRTGEEPGRVLHEQDRFERDGYLSHYNAAETSQLLLAAAGEWNEAHPDEAQPILRDLRVALASAVSYITSHLQGGLFLEDPRRCGADRYMAHATYWKDSHLPARRTLDYPVAYSLVQAQTVAALRASAALSQVIPLGADPEALTEAAGRGRDHLWTTLWDDELASPLIALDHGAPVRGVSSDALHLLAYLRPGDVPAARLRDLLAVADRLATQYGYRSYAPGQPDYAPDAYHLGSIWPYEQAFIARGAHTFRLPSLFDGAAAVRAALEAVGFPELLIWDGESLRGGGCDLQLWSSAVPAAFSLLAPDRP